ncbi:hypothetical protein [Jiangella alba]|uniref:Uncharacterized protein n=1 Tax=Jiangella alba TaxID=561176 RepID=A0A1H5P7P4_9ACTN|nr:hypothetical protein [Jiangella alba]SEF09008.1 hypothetical protein SAMN04488561_3737 [Jiangella alba]
MRFDRTVYDQLSDAEKAAYARAAAQDDEDETETDGIAREKAGREGLEIVEE